MARFDFQSPGAAFTSQIADALAQRKAEERQRMLDQLTVNADVRAQESARRQEAESKAQLAEAAQRQELSRLGALEAPLDADEDPTMRGYSPEDVALLQKWGRLKQLPTPQTSTSTEFAPSQTSENEDLVMEPSAPIVEQSATPAQKRFGYVGTPQQRERQRLRAQSSELIAGLLQDPKTAESGKFLARLAQANDGLVPGEVMAQFIAPETPLYEYDESTGKVSQRTSLPPNAKLITRDRPPASYFAPPPTMQYVGQDPADPTMQIFMRRDGSITKVPGIRGAAATASARGRDALGIPATYMDDIDLAEGSLGYDPRAVDETALSKYRGVMRRALSNAAVGSKPVKQLAVEYLSNPGATESKVAQMIDANKLTEKDVNDYLMLINAVPDEVKEILKLNPYQPGKEKPSWWENITGVFNGKQ